MSKIKDYGVFDIDHRPIAVQLGLRAVDTVSKRKLLRRRGYNAHHLCLLFRQKTNVHPKFRFPQYKFYPKVKSPPLSRFRTKIPKLSSSQALSLSLSLSLALIRLSLSASTEVGAGIFRSLFRYYPNPTSQPAT